MLAEAAQNSSFDPSRSHSFTVDFCGINIPTKEIQGWALSVSGAQLPALSYASSTIRALSDLAISLIDYTDLLPIYSVENINEKLTNILVNKVLSNAEGNTYESWWFRGMSLKSTITGYLDYSTNTSMSYTCYFSFESGELIRRHTVDGVSSDIHHKFYPISYTE
jgi:hypothetical protein